MLPREKFLENGVGYLSDTDLVAIIIGSGIKGKNFNNIARCVIRRFQKILKNSEQINIAQLTDIDGVGEIVAMKLIAGIELGRRLYSLHSQEKEIIRSGKDSFEILKDIGFLKKERVDAIYLNSRFELLNREMLAVGSLNCTNLLPRDVILPALMCNAAFVVIAHNHPSGDCTPSIEDLELTKRISEALNLVGIQLLDHLVISSKQYTSIEI